MQSLNVAQQIYKLFGVEPGVKPTANAKFNSKRWEKITFKGDKLSQKAALNSLTKKN